MLLRVVGTLLFPLCGWLAGDAVRQKTDGHLRALEGTILLFQRIRQEVHYRRTDLQQLYCCLQQEGLAPEAEAGRLLQQLPPPEALFPAEQTAFAECISGLGRAEADQECERMDFYIARFQDSLQRARKKAQMQAGLPQKLGLAAGTVLALVLI